MASQRPSVLETLGLVVPAVGFVAMMAAGDRNGIGVFHQPENGLLVPLVTGLLANAGAFYVQAFRLLPDFLSQRRVVRFAAGLSGLAAALLLGKTAAHWIIIQVAEPSLRQVGWSDLLTENSYSVFGILIAATIYGLARNGLRPAERPDPVANDDSSHLDFWSGRTLHRLQGDEVLYLEGKGNYVKVVSRNRSVLVYTTLRDQEARLCTGFDFARIHRSYIVSLKNLETADASTVRIGDRRLPVSERYSRLLLEKLRGRQMGAGASGAPSSPG